jgi:site-specific recombinase XerD
MDVQRAHTWQYWADRWIEDKSRSRANALYGEIKSFMEFASGRGRRWKPVPELRRLHLVGYAEHLRDRRLKEATITRKLSVVCSFTAFVHVASPYVMPVNIGDEYKARPFTGDVIDRTIAVFKRWSEGQA